jgi:hypothetical protein
MEGLIIALGTADGDVRLLARDHRGESGPVARDGVGFSCWVSEWLMLLFALTSHVRQSGLILMADGVSEAACRDRRGHNVCRDL